MALQDNFLGCLSLKTGGILIGLWNVFFHGTVALILFINKEMALSPDDVTENKNEVKLYGLLDALKKIDEDMVFYIFEFYAIYNIVVVAIAFFCIIGVVTRQTWLVKPLLLIYIIGFHQSVIEAIIGFFLTFKFGSFATFATAIWIWAILQIVFQAYFVIILYSFNKSCKENSGLVEVEM